MKILVPLLVTTLLFPGVFIGCQAPPTKSAPGNTGYSIRNNCYSLLHQLLDDEKDVSLLRFIKREQDDVKTLVKRIAAASGAGAKLLEEFAKKDSWIRLDDDRLPPGETATRDAIAATKKKELLGQSGDRFELSLLLAQAEALSYASHLAKVGAQNEAQPARARAVAAVGEEMRNLNQELFGLLLSKTTASPTSQSRTQKK